MLLIYAVTTWSTFIPHLSHKHRETASRVTEYSQYDANNTDTESVWYKLSLADWKENRQWPETACKCEVRGPGTVWEPTRKPTLGVSPEMRAPVHSRNKRTWWLAGPERREGGLTW